MSDDERPRESVSADETVVPASPAIDDPGAETWDPFEELQEEYGESGPGLYTTAADGMPTQVDQTVGSDIPPLSPATLVCMADMSAFVVRDRWGHELARFSPAAVERTPDGSYRVPRSLYDAQVSSARGALAGWLGRKLMTKREGGRASSLRRLLARWLGESYVTVQPLRPECHHYGRQHSSFPENPTADYFSRVCTARRSTEGAFMGVGNVAMYGCSLREPRDLDAEQRMDAFDEKKMAQGRRRRHLPMKGGIFE